MSVLLNLKNLIVLHLDDKMPSEVKAAVMRVYNSIDGDLDMGGYETSFETDEALINLDKVLTGQEDEREQTELESETNRPIEVPRSRKPTVAPRGEDDENNNVG